METIKQWRPEAADGHDAVPRDGPAIYLADAAVLHAGRLIGRWVRLDTPLAEVAEEVGQLVGERPDNWVVIDQVGIGEAMLDEQPTLIELLAALHHESGQ